MGRARGRRLPVVNALVPNYTEFEGKVLQGEVFFIVGEV